MSETVEWAVPMPEVKSYCKRCARAWVYVYVDQWDVISPTGKAHIGGEDEFTACGISTAGRNYENWWWRL